MTLQDIDSMVMESDYQTTVSMLDYTIKQYEMEQYYQEGIGDERLNYRGTDKNGNKEHILMSILKFIGRLINNIVYRIKNLFRKNKSNQVKTQTAEQTIQNPDKQKVKEILEENKGKAELPVSKQSNEDGAKTKIKLDHEEESITVETEVDPPKNSQESKPVKVEVTLSAKENVKTTITTNVDPKKSEALNSEIDTLIDELIKEIEHTASIENEITGGKNAMLIKMRQIQIDAVRRMRDVDKLKDAINKEKDTQKQFQIDLESIREMRAKVAAETEKLEQVAKAATKAASTVTRNDDEVKADMIEHAKNVSKIAKEVGETVKEQSTLVTTTYDNAVQTAANLIGGAGEKQSSKKTSVSSKLSGGVQFIDEKWVQEKRKIIDGLHDFFTEANVKVAISKFNKTFDDFDEDDTETFVLDFHELVEKYIYGSDTKVDGTMWDKAEKALIAMGYKKYTIKPGEPIKNYQTLFARPIAANSGDGEPGTIKHIQLMPFVLKYKGKDGDSGELKLCGKCSYYPAA